MRHAPAFMLFLSFAMTSSLASAGSWSRLRGPDGDGHVERPIASDFSTTKNVAWKTAIPGQGWSSPIVTETMIWMTTATEEGWSLRVVGVDRKSGELLHDVEVFRPDKRPDKHGKNSYASPTPVIEGTRLYVHFGTVGTACLDIKTMQVLWKNEDLKIDHEVGPGSSPTLFEDLLLLTCDGMDRQFVAALDKMTGAVAWKTDRTGVIAESLPHRKAFCTPAVFNIGGRNQMITLAADHGTAHDARTGEEIWKVRYNGFSNVPLPLYAGGLLYLCTGFGKAELWAVDPTGQGDVTDTHVRWKHLGQVPHISSPIIVDSRIYFVGDRGVATCLDIQSGDEVWRDRLDGNFAASPLHIAGQLYFFSEEGVVYVIPAGEKFEILKRIEMDEPILSTPAALDGELYLRTAGHLYRINESTEGKHNES